MDAVKMDALVVLMQRLNVYVFLLYHSFFFKDFFRLDLFENASTSFFEWKLEFFKLEMSLTTIYDYTGFKIESKYFVHYCGYIDGNWMVGVHRRNRGFG